MTEVEEVYLDEATLKANVAIQTRVIIDGDTLERCEYGLTTDRDSVPPVVLFKDSDGHIWIGDGHHRCRASARLEIPVRAEVRPGSMLDALRYAMSANATHGKPRNTNDLAKAFHLAQDFNLVDCEDKDAVAELLGCSVRHADRYAGPLRSNRRRKRDRQIRELHAQGKTEREIADTLGVSQATVNRVIQNGQVSKTNQEKSKNGSDDKDADGQIDQQQENKDATAEIPQLDKTTDADSSDSPPLSAYGSLSHEPTEPKAIPPNPVESDPWDALTAALASFLQSSPEQPTGEQSEVAQSLINEVRDYLVTTTFES